MLAFAVGAFGYALTPALLRMHSSVRDACWGSARRNCAPGQMRVRHKVPATPHRAPATKA
eukprot:4944201-Alexandrium_andersonii.AAC.1